ncbi:hypothetical protein V2S66_26685 [Streptomyces sp. V4-01]|uniref:XRE family transcriptional regulator n=1 Tax=Actinacidiphila polyblastidii TaxID=3110430 RepID=A0ABU7PI95_9ACTN|nr:hypothetical protein [Streptomyces sp. V4-01]
MTSQHETLTELVASALANGLTYRAFHDRAVDPASGYRPSMATLHKVSEGRSIRVTPELVSAIAAGLRVAPLRAQRAASFQYAGLPATAVGGGEVLREPDAPLVPLEPERALIQDWDEKEADQRNHQAG